MVPSRRTITKKSLGICWPCRQSPLLSFLIDLRDPVTSECGKQQKKLASTLLSVFLSLPFLHSCPGTGRVGNQRRPFRTLWHTMATWVLSPYLAPLPPVAQGCASATKCAANPAPDSLLLCATPRPKPVLKQRQRVHTHYALC